jgi:hypothetical protein
MEYERPAIDAREVVHGAPNRPDTRSRVVTGPTPAWECRRAKRPVAAVFETRSIVG